MKGSSPSLFKKLAKEIYFSLGNKGWRILGWWLLTPRIVVLNYHRVSDDVRDNLTVGIEQFDRQMGLLRKYFSPVSLEQVINMTVIPVTNKPIVAVTFDDGYLDNYSHAVPILKRHGIPAAFFVSTGIVEANGRFPHDVRRKTPHIPLMNWDQLRQMRNTGFLIGSHTVNHIDCASEAKELVRCELAHSRDKLVHELGASDYIFAYPYGQQHNMTPERLKWVEEMGYVACLSAYGGANVGFINRFDIKRRGIHWEFSDRAFLFECLGL